MAISADFKKQKQYFVKKISLCRIIAISLYRNIARQNRSSDEGLKEKIEGTIVNEHSIHLSHCAQPTRNR